MVGQRQRSEFDWVGSRNMLGGINGIPGVADNCVTSVGGSRRNYF